MGVFRASTMISAPVSTVWDFIILPGNLHLWGPYTQPASGADHPLQTGDRLTLSRRDFLRNTTQVLLVEQVIPYHSFELRDLSPMARRMNVTATIRVEAGKDRETTWIEEAIFYSPGKNRVVQWLDRRLINPLLQPLASYGTQKAFRRLQAAIHNR